MISKIIKIILVVVWMGVIFAFSSDNGEASEEKSDSTILEIYKIFDKRDLTEKEEEQVIQRFVMPVRKIAHLTEYFILAVLIASLLSEYLAVTFKNCLITVLLCFLYATSDEIHQLFSSGRSGRVLDVLIDTAGSCLGVISYSFISRKILRRKIYE